MTSRIHFICKDRKGVRTIDAKSAVYESAAWLLSPDEMGALEGGRIFFHQTKSTPSYFGGTILNARPVDGESPGEGGRVRWAITLRSQLDGKGVDWDQAGYTHGMAWTSGVIQAEATG